MFARLLLTLHSPFLLLFFIVANLAAQGQAARVNLQRGVLNRGLVAAIAALPKLSLFYYSWKEKQHWLHNPDDYLELSELLTQLGVSGEEFMQAMTQFGEDQKANALFNALLAEYDLSRADFGVSGCGDRSCYRHGAAALLLWRETNNFD